MTHYHVEVLTPGPNRTDMTTRSRYYADARRRELDLRGSLAEIRDGAGRRIVNIDGEVQR